MTKTRSRAKNDVMTTFKGTLGLLAFACATACSSSHAAAPSGNGDADLSTATTAFYETLSGAKDDSARVISLVRPVQKAHPDATLAFWMSAAMLTFQVSHATTGNVHDLARAPKELADSLAEAQANAERAAVLAKQQDVHIAILPTWPGLTTFLHAYATGDGALQDLAVERLRAGVEDDTELGSLMFAATVGQFLDRTDPLFREAVTLADNAIAKAGDCTKNEPEICGNQGAAPHGVEGALLIFGDLYAKDGQVDRATAMYQLSLSGGQADRWRYASEVEARLGSVADRAALYANADPDDDPAFGVPNEFCGACHYR